MHLILDDSNVTPYAFFCNLALLNAVVVILDFRLSRDDFGFWRVPEEVPTKKNVISYIKISWPDEYINDLT